MGPAYPLNSIKRLIKNDRFYITETALKTAGLIGFFYEDIIDCILNDLNESHFYKTMPSDQVVGLMQDVYKIVYEGQKVYLKVQINRKGSAVIISFKEDESQF